MGRPRKTFQCASIVRTWLPDELLFSLCSRHHVLSGNKRPSDTRLELFGHPRHGGEHDFPSRLGTFVKRTGGLFGTACEIIWKHTSIPIYFACFSPDRIASVVAALESGSALGLRPTVGLTASHFGAPPLLKACATCIADDLQRFRVAYWHRTHQFPGVVLCPLHLEPLLQMTVAELGHGRSDWFLPSAEVIRLDGSCRRHQCPKSAEASTLFAQALGTLDSGDQINREVLRNTYARALFEKGYMPASLRGLKHAQTAAAFNPVRFELSQFEDFAKLPCEESSAAEHVVNALRERGQTIHPLWHIPLMVWLFGGWPHFRYAYKACARRMALSAEPTKNSVTNVGGTSRGTRRREFLRLMRDERFSASKASRKVGVGVNVGAVWAKRDGLKVESRPRKISRDLRLEIAARLRQGMPKESVGSLLHVSRSSVDQVLRSDVQLHAEWRRSQFVNRLLDATEKWRAVLAETDFRVRVARVVAPAAYEWLYRNQRSTLLRLNARLPLGSGGN